MMIRFRTLTAGALVAGLLVTGAAFAQGPRGGGPGRGGPAGPMMRMGGLPLAGIELTPGQQDLIRDIQERSREEGRQAEARVREAQEAQRQAVDAIPLNEGAIRAATLALADAQAEAAIRTARVQNEIWLVLTVAQQEQVAARRAERDQRMAQRQQQAQPRRQSRP
jgi:Spy/CpxP family protein refolding chaperone